MKIKDFFDENWTIKWDDIFEIPCFDDLKLTPQSLKWYRGVSASCHTKLVPNELDKILTENNISKGSDEWILCMSAAICHDLGKSVATFYSNKRMDWSTNNHSIASEKITRNLLYDEEIEIREKICYMVRHHMVLHHIFDKPNKTDRRLIKLSHGLIPIKYMLYLNFADSIDSMNRAETEESLTNKYNKVVERCLALDCYDKPFSLVDKSQLIRDFIDCKDEIVNKNNDFSVYIMCGFPGCGKSTYIKNYLSDKTIISRDTIRGELGINGATIDNDKKVDGTKEEDEISEIFNKKMIECCEKKESFVIDNTNLKRQYRKDYLLKIMKYNPKVNIIYVEAQNFINNCIDIRNDEISKSVYDKMNDDFDFPQLYECDRLIIVKENTISEKSYEYNSNI